ncbi:MAG: hypothetical protein H7A44_04940 [Opitutaceae bacterium]|nr:hypothetical protein [Cephaloticoccus sp.]MCP5529769.1 hypothetical protein [Opitutaceae bacterium]
MTSCRYLRLTTVFMSMCLAPLLAQDQKPDDSEPAPSTRNTRAISPEVAAALAAGMPKYNPPKPVEKSGEDIDMREVDKPRNQIIRLPEYVVREEKPPVFRERDIYTQKGLRELARMRYLSETGQALNRFNIPLFGMGADAYALMRYEEEERLSNISDLNETARDVSLTDPESAQAIREATRDTYARENPITYRKQN